MIEVILPIALQAMAHKPAPAYTRPRAATSWSCQFDDRNGSRFRLKGTFPATAVGWNPNHYKDFTVESSGADQFSGDAEVKIFGQTREVRDYFFIKRFPDGVIYNFTLMLRKEGSGLANVTVYNPNAENREARLSAYATGRCKAEFTPDQDNS